MYMGCSWASPFSKLTVAWWGALVLSDTKMGVFLNQSLRDGFKVFLLLDHCERAWKRRITF